MPAAVTAELTVSGLDELDAMLRALPAELAGPIMHDALAAGGEVIRIAARGNIRSRSGKTANDLRVDVKVQPEASAGIALVGGTRGGSDGRGWVLRLLEFGARGKKGGGKGWDIQGGAEDARQARKAIKALRRIGNPAGAATLKAGLASGDVVTRRALKLPGGLFRARAHHPGFAPQAPMTRALASAGQQAVNVFASTLWHRLTGRIQQRYRPAA